MMVINGLSPLPRVSTPGILRRLSLSIAMMSVICVGIGCVCALTQDDRTGSGANIERDSLTLVGHSDSLGSYGVSQVTVREFFMELDSPESLEAVVTDCSLKIEGRKRIDAFVSLPFGYILAISG